MNDPVFICPFNAYHKIFDHRKHMFHIARCKDRRGKSMFHCKYKHAHIYTSLELLLQQNENTLTYSLSNKYHSNIFGSQGLLPSDAPVE